MAVVMSPRSAVMRVLLAVAVMVAITAAVLVAPTSASSTELVAPTERTLGCTIRQCLPCGPTIPGRCAAGTVCGRNNRGKLTCVKHMKVGQWCNDPCWTCAPGLKCGTNGRCAALPAVTIRPCHPCGGKIRGRCAAGTKCAKNNSGTLSCVSPMGVGRKCTDPCWVCAKGLTCARTGTCQKPGGRILLRHCDRCGPGFVGVCPKGTFCMSTHPLLPNTKSCAVHGKVGTYCSHGCARCPGNVGCGPKGCLDLTKWR